MRQCVRRPHNGLAHARMPRDTFEHVGSGAAAGWRCPGQASRPADFSRLLLSCDSAFRREARTELAMPSPKFDPTATGPSGLAIANHVVRLPSAYTGRGGTKAANEVSATTWSRRSSGSCSPRGERSLVRDGRADLVLDLRRAYQARQATISPTESKRSPDATYRLPQRQPHRPRQVVARSADRWRAAASAPASCAIFASARCAFMTASAWAASRRRPRARGVVAVTRPPARAPCSVGQSPASARHALVSATTRSPCRLHGLLPESGGRTQ